MDKDPVPATTPSTPSSTVDASPVQPVAQPSVVARPERSGRSRRAVLIALLVIMVLGVAGWLIERARTSRVSAAARTASSGPSLASAPPAQKVSTAGQGAVVPDAPVASNAASGVPPDAADTETATASKPCSLVTRGEMATILRSPIVKVTTSELTCNYFTDDTMSAGVETTWTGGKDAFAQVKGFNSAPGLSKPVDGIGDEAYLQAAGVLHILKNDTYVVVNSRVYPNELETESAIGAQAMKRLK